MPLQLPCPVCETFWCRCPASLLHAELTRTSMVQYIALAQPAYLQHWDAAHLDAVPVMKTQSSCMDLCDCSCCTDLCDCNCCLRGVCDCFVWCSWHHCSLTAISSQGLYQKLGATYHRQAHQCYFLHACSSTVTCNAHRSDTLSTAWLAYLAAVASHFTL